MVNALAPAEVTKVVLDEEAERIEVVVPDEQLSLAIGRRGQNVRLASQLTGWDIDIMTEAEESERRQKEFAEPAPSSSSKRSMSTRRWRSCWRPKASPRSRRSPMSMLHEIASIEGLDEQTARGTAERAHAIISSAKRPNWMPSASELGVDDALREIDGVTPAMLVALGEAGIKTVEDLAGCATDDLIGWTERKHGETSEAQGRFLRSRSCRPPRPAA